MARNQSAYRITHKHGNIAGWEAAMWREQERMEIADREEAARVASRALLTSSIDAWRENPVPTMPLVIVHPDDAPEMLEVWFP